DRRLRRGRGGRPHGAVRCHGGLGGRAGAPRRRRPHVPHLTAGSAINTLKIRPAAARLPRGGEPFLRKTVGRDRTSSNPAGVSAICEHSLAGRGEGLMAEETSRACPRCGGPIYPGETVYAVRGRWARVLEVEEGESVCSTCALGEPLDSESDDDE